MYGQRYNVLAAKARELQARMAKVRGVRRARVAGLPVQEPTIDVAVNVDAALRHGLKPGDIRRAVATDIEGLTVGNFFEQQKVFDVTVQGTPATHDTVPKIRSLRIDQPLQRRDQLRVMILGTLAPAPRPAGNPHRRWRRILQLRTAPPHRIRGNPHRLGDQHRPAHTQLPRLGAQPQPPLTLT